MKQLLKNSKKKKKSINYASKYSNKVDNYKYKHFLTHKNQNLSATEPYFKKY